jgi:hypothetical protein
MGVPHLVGAHRVAKTVMVRRPLCVVWRCGRDCIVLWASFNQRGQDLWINLKVRGNLVFLMRICNRISGLIDEDTQSDWRMIV